MAHGFKRVYADWFLTDCEKVLADFADWADLFKIIREFVAKKQPTDDTGLNGFTLIGF